MLSISFVFSISDGIRNFSSNANSVKNWCLNRADQSKHTGRLKAKAGLSDEAYTYSNLRSSRILQSEKAVKSVVNVLTEEYINPFHPTLDLTQLVNLSSGISVESTEVLRCWEIGEKKHKEFTEQRIENKVISFHHPIKKEHLKFFSDNSTKISKAGRISSVTVNRNIISKLLTISFQTGKQIDFEAALAYPLTPVPLSLANPDGSRRVTQKSKLVEVLRSYVSTEQAEVTDANVFILDFIAQVRVITKEVPETYK